MINEPRGGGGSLFTGLRETEILDRELKRRKLVVPDGWDLLLDHQVSQEEVMLGQNEPVDDFLSDLWDHAAEY